MIKFHNATDKDGHIIHIDEVTKENRAEHYYCVGCGEEMSAILGDKREHHFRHTVAHCSWESYLHKLAKRRIKEHFESSGEFMVLQQKEVECICDEVCDFFNFYSCRKRNNCQHNLKNFYDTCMEEAPIKGFVADLLLSKYDNKDREPVLIEVLVTHACEPEKIRSGLKIIETTKIESEEDIDNIIRNGFIERINCILYNFKELPRIKVDTNPIERFILHASGGATTKQISCKYLNTRIEKDSIAELNLNLVKGNRHQIYHGSKAYLCAGLYYLRKKGMDVKNCLICKYYKEGSYSNFYYNEPICSLYKKCETPRNPKQSSAIKCQYFSISSDIIKMIEPFLYEVVSELKSPMETERGK